MALTEEQVIAQLQEIPDEVFRRISFSMPWQDEGENRIDYEDPDKGLYGKDIDYTTYNREKLVRECWLKYHGNPYVNTAIRSQIGRMVGKDFEVSSGEWNLQRILEDHWIDPRNRLYNFLPKYVGRCLIEGELYLILTVHEEGFVEIDFLDPASLTATGTDASGIVFHPNKTLMPLFYLVETELGGEVNAIPSIFVSHYPDELLAIAKEDPYFKVKDSLRNKSRKKVYRNMGGYFRFVIGWDRGLLTRRAVSYLRTIIVWLNHYENLKKYEIDHKRSSAAYLWTFSFDDVSAFKTWLSLTDEERRKTGIGAKKTPGSSIVLPPGMKLSVENPQLGKITEQDEDIKEMISSGLNEFSDTMTGNLKSTFASAKAARGPMSDRTSDEIALLENFLRFDMYGSIFHLLWRVGQMPRRVTKKVAVDFNDSGEPVYKNVERRPELLIDFTWPISESIDYEGRAKGMLGTKHGPLSETLGIPHSDIIKRFGFGNYKRLRLRHAQEKEAYPELVYTMDAESIQEQAEGEATQKKKKPGGQSNGQQ